MVAINPSMATAFRSGLPITCSGVWDRRRDGRAGARRARPRLRATHGLPIVQVVAPRRGTVVDVEREPFTDASGGDVP